MPECAGESVGPPIFLTVAISQPYVAKRQGRCGKVLLVVAFTHPDSVNVILIDNRDLGRAARPGLNGVLVKLAVVADHVELLLHRRVSEGLLDLVVAGEKDDALLGAKKGELVLTGFIERGEVETSDANTDEWCKLSRGIHVSDTPLVSMEKRDKEGAWIALISY